MNTDNFFCKNYTNRKQIHQIINQAYQTAVKFQGTIKNKQITIPDLKLTNLSLEHLFFSCTNQPDLNLSTGKELTLSFHVQLGETMLPCECTVSVVTYNQKENKLFIIAMFPYSISLMQRREQVRYPIKEEDFSCYTLLFTNTQVINENEWQPVCSSAVKYNEISAGGLSLALNTKDISNLPTNKSVLILKCKYPPLYPPDAAKKEFYSFIIVAKIFHLSKKGNEIFIRAKFSHWSYNTANRKWNIVQSHTGISQLLPYIAPAE